MNPDERRWLLDHCKPEDYSRYELGFARYVRQTRAALCKQGKTAK